MSDLVERLERLLRELDRTPRRRGTWESGERTDYWPYLVEDVVPDPRYL